MRIAVASGKGGTGKTFVATNLSAVAGTDMADLDVEEPNAHLFFPGEEVARCPVSRPVPRIDQERCDLCGECVRICAFSALMRMPTRIAVHDEMCHGCGGCVLVCPKKAVREVPHPLGAAVRVRWEDRHLLYGILNVGEPMATPLIRAVKDMLSSGKDVIMDCPPGTSCQMVESVRGCDLCVLVTEPTPFGLHDLRLAVGTLRKLDLRHGVVINKEGMGGSDIDQYCRDEGIPVLGRLPFQRGIAREYAEGRLATSDPKIAGRFREIWKAVLREVGR